MLRLISWRELGVRLGGLSRSTLQRQQAQDPSFPRQVEISPGRVGFPEDEADAYVALLIARRDKAEAV